MEVEGGRVGERKEGVVGRAVAEAGSTSLLFRIERRNVELSEYLTVKGALVAED